jgi:aspartyl-tRNA(Asn)/glutamyl-tRNA(Gln) amidotransferase subunit B
MQLLELGDKVMQETRGWDGTKEKTVSQREKEEAHDYRYFPEPDLPPLHHSNKVIEKIRLEIPELPQQKRERFKKEYELGDKEIEFFASYRDLSDYFEKVMSELRNWIKEGRVKEKVTRPEFIKLAKICANYIITDLQGLLKGKSVIDEKFLITPENFAEFIYLIYENKLSSKMAKIVLEEMLKTGADPSHIIKEKGLVQITDEAEIEKIIKEVLTKNQKVVADFKKGKETALQYLVGQVMAETRGKASPQLVQKILKTLLTK